MIYLLNKKKTLFVEKYGKTVYQKIKLFNILYIIICINIALRSLEKI